MNPLMRLNKKQIKKHILFWVIIVVYLNLDGPVPGSWTAKIVGGVLLYSSYIFVFYSLSMFVFPKFWDSNRYYLFLSIILCLILYWALAYLISLKLIPYLGGSSFYQKKPFSYFLVKKLFYFFIIAPSAIASFFYRYSIYKFKIQAEKEKSLLVTELGFLKNQFNSHITFNFLNYCYSRIHRHSNEAAESIELFSDMLRYSLKTRPDEKIAISDEIAHIENYLNLQKQLNVKFFANFYYKNKFNGFLISPYILFNLVEIALKNAVSNEPQSPIVINLEINSNKLFYEIQSKKNLKEKMQSVLTDLEEVAQILDSYYAENFKLRTEEKDGFVYINLRIEELA